jgi:membrane protein DedA with SNARE-associated domain
VLGAAVFEMKFRNFLLAIFAGRFVRFLTLSLLTLWYGPQIVELMGTLFRRHGIWIFIGLATLAVLGWALSRRRNKARAKTA